MKKNHIFLLTVILTFIFITNIHCNEIQPLVHVIKINGVINPASADFINRSIEKAKSKNANLIVIELDTPGGLDTSMRSIVKDISASPIPVVIYVSPSGARAASAGVFITLSAHVAAMAPGTNIGAAHPVAVGEKMDKTVAEKAVNDASAYIKSIAESHGRNAQWAEQAVRNSLSITEKEALKLNVIDLIAEDLTTLLKAIDKKTVKTVIGEKVINTTNAKIIYEEKGMKHKILDFISDPNVAYMLMLIGFYGIFFELTNPGSIFPGVVGVISLILAFYSFQTLPVNYAGLLLIIAGLVLFLLEIKIVSYGLLTLGGIASIILGSLMLFDSPEPFMRLSLSIIIPSAIVSALFFIITFRLAYKAYKSKPVTGIESMIGETGIAKEPIDSHSGKIYINGEIWNARSDDFIEVNSEVVVESIKGLVLKVKKS